MSQHSAPTTGTTENLHSFFHRRITMAIDHQNVDTSDATVWYLCHLLADYARSERLFDFTEHGIALRPLAELYAGSVAASSRAERDLLLQRLGDVALFVAGLFSGLLDHPRRTIGIDYYIGMGESAYSSLAYRQQTARNEVFAELADQFPLFVAVLNEVGGHKGSPLPGFSAGHLH